MRILKNQIYHDFILEHKEVIEKIDVKKHFPGILWIQLTTSKQENGHLNREKKSGKWSFYFQSLKIIQYLWSYLHVSKKQ